MNTVVELKVVPHILKRGLVVPAYKGVVRILLG